MAGIYAHHLSDEGGGYGQRIPDKKCCMALFDKRLENELMSFGAKVFEKPLSQIATLMFRHSEPSKVYEFFEEAAGSNAKYWARFVYHFVIFWQDGQVEINSELIPKVPNKSLMMALDVLKNADMIGWADHEIRAARAFVNNWSPPQGPG
jgi:hypothetical protein